MQSYNQAYAGADLAAASQTLNTRIRKTARAILQAEVYSCQIHPPLLSTLCVY